MYRQLCLFAGINGEAESTDVTLDAWIKAKQLPPPPFKSMVKGISACSKIMAVNMLLPFPRWAYKTRACIPWIEPRFVLQTGISDGFTGRCCQCV